MSPKRASINFRHAALLLASLAPNRSTNAMNRGSPNRPSQRLLDSRDTGVLLVLVLVQEICQPFTRSANYFHVWSWQGAFSSSILSARMAGHRLRSRASRFSDTKGTAEVLEVSWPTSIASRSSSGKHQPAHRRKSLACHAVESGSSGYLPSPRPASSPKCLLCSRPAFRMQPRPPT